MEGVGHADELWLQWDPYGDHHYGLPTDDLEVSRYITTMWSNFIKSGDPTPSECGNSQYNISCKIGVEWTARNRERNK